MSKELIDQIPQKSIEDSFRDWESSTFGFGYGTGEEHTIPALVRALMDIKQHSIEPFTSHKWLFYAHDVAEKALAALPPELVNQSHLESQSPVDK